MLPYWVAQLVGGFGAVLVMAIVYSSEVTDALRDRNRAAASTTGRRSCSRSSRPALFVMVILTVATDERAAWNGVMAPFLIGLFIFTAAVTVGPASGGSFNPARSLDPVLYNQEWGDVWIYIVGPAGARRRRARRRDRRLGSPSAYLVYGDSQEPARTASARPASRRDGGPLDPIPSGRRASRSPPTATARRPPALSAG